MIIYISGPMSGYVESNFPAFEVAAKRLRQQGFTVISPHEIEPKENTWAACMRSDIKQLMDAESVAVLQGWEKSKGAGIEVGLAIKLGMQIMDAETLQPVKIPYDL